jgi:ribosomal protein S18 acetylase RimI-like enzyme
LIEIRLNQLSKMEIKVRKATSNDCEFIAQIILASESTGHEVISFSKMFRMTNRELIPVFEHMINNDTDGHPLTYKTYYIAECNGSYCGALSTYIEGLHGSSNLMMANLMMASMDRSKVIEGFMLSKDNSEIQIPKENGFRQIDCVATLEAYQGKGVFKKLFSIIEDFNRNEPSKGMEVQVWKDNPAIRVYEKVGFKKVKTHLSKQNYDMGKVLLRKQI